LTRSTLDAYWKILPAPQRDHYDKNGGERAYLDDLIRQKLLALEAQEQHLDRDPEIATRLEGARDSILGRALVEREVTDQILTEDALREYYEAHLQGFEIPEMVRARHILVTPHAQGPGTNSTGDDATDEDQAKAKIERLRKELAAGADFADLARKYSEDITADKGGMLEPFARGRMAKPFEEVAFSLEPGKVSDVVRTPYGYHLIQVVERIPARIPPFEEVRDRIRQAVAQERRDSFQPRLDALEQRLRAKFPVWVSDELEAPSTVPTPAK